MSAKAEAFAARWRPILEDGALVKFAYGPRGEAQGNHCQIADEFISTLGLKPIGFNWELLDAYAAKDEARSASGELVKAFAQRIDNPSKDWLDLTQARECADAFLGLFDTGTLTLVSNRYDGLWNPIAGGSAEWGFVGFDEDQIALLLLAD